MRGTLTGNRFAGTAPLARFPNQLSKFPLDWLASFVAADDTLHCQVRLSTVSAAVAAEAGVDGTHCRYRLKRSCIAVAPVALAAVAVDMARLDPAGAELHTFQSAPLHTF